MWNGVFRRRAPSAYGHERSFRQTILAGLVASLAFAALAAPPAQARKWRLVALGDSLTAGYNLPADAAFPAVLQKALREKGYDVDIDNAGVSGDTSGGARERLDWAVAEGADGVILEIGANDMLRGMNPEMTRDNIDAILARLHEKKIPTLLAGMVTAPNLGRDYAAEFNPIYPELAKKFGVTLYPFFLEGVAGHKDRQLPDGLHPNRQGVETIVAGILPLVTAWLDGLNRP